ncbi:MAG: leucine-rich repeat protein [Eubacterium sp.]|nr:leucine-rich repeat protein [Eubacterium sp.]
MKKKKLFKVTFLSTLAVSMIFSYGYAETPLFKPSSYVGQVEAAGVRSLFKSEKLYKVMQILVNAKMAGVDVYSQSGINPDTTDITTWSRASEFMQDELDEDSITLYTGRVDLKPYNLGNGDLAGLKLASLVTEIDLPTSITELQDGVFENMTDLKVVKMPAGVTKIGVNAFKRCLALNKISVYGNSETAGVLDLAKVTSLGNSAFLGCNQFTGLKLSNNINMLDSNAFANCSKLSGAVSIPGTVTKLGTGVFTGCSSLDKITFAANITEIPNAFLSEINNANGLTVEIPSGSKISRIGNSAFRSTTIKSINIENAAGYLTTIDRSAFDDAIIMSELKLGSLNKLTTIGISGFFNSSFAVTDITLPASLTDLGSAAFAGSDITSINIPDGITTLNSGVFCCTPFLNKVTIKNTSNLKVIGDYAFTFDGNLKSTKDFLQNTTKLTTIGNYAFAYCVKLKIENSTLKVSLDSNNRIEGLETVYLPNSVTSIGDYCFYDTPSIKTVESLGSITSVPAYAFAVENIKTLPKWAESITLVAEDVENESVILNGKGLADYYKTADNISETSQNMSVKLPMGITQICEYAFAYRERINNVYTSTSSSGVIDLSGLSSLKAIKESAFSNCSYYIDGKTTSVNDIDGIKELRLPKSLETIGKKAFYQDYGLGEVKFSGSSSLKKIDDQAFSECCPAKIAETTECGLRVLTNFSSQTSLETIGKNAFSKNTYLKLDNSGSTFAFPGAVKTIDDYAFSECKETVNIRFNSNIETIGRNAFSDNKKLQTISFVNSRKLTTLGQYAFAGDDKLSNVDMGNTKIDKVSAYAFSNCTNLTEFSAPDASLKLIESNAFNMCPSLAAIHFPVDAQISSLAFGNPATKVPSLNISLGTLENGLDVPFGQTIVFEANAFVECSSVQFYRDGNIDINNDPEDYFTISHRNNSKQFFITGGATAKANGTKANIQGNYIFGGKSKSATIDIPVRIVGVQAKNVFMTQKQQTGGVFMDVDNSNMEISRSVEWTRGSKTTSNQAKYVGYINGSRISTNMSNPTFVNLQANIDPSTFTYGTGSQANNLRWEVASGADVIAIEGAADNKLPINGGYTDTTPGKFFESKQKIMVKGKGKAVLRLVYSHTNHSTGNIAYDCINLVELNVVNPISKFDCILSETGKASNIELIQGNVSNIKTSGIEYTDKTSTTYNEPTGLLYYSDDPEVATVNASGVITAKKIYDNGYYDTKKKNSCTITVRTHSGSVSKSVRVTVRKSKEETVPTELEIVGDDFLNFGGVSKTYTVKNIPALSNENVEWSISGGAATLKQEGNKAILNAVRVGSVTISAKSKVGSIRQTKTVKITAPTKNIKFLMKSASVEVDSMYSFGFVSDDKNTIGIFRPKDNDDHVSFSVADGSIAQIAARNDGKSYGTKIVANSGTLYVKGLKAGKTVITATTESGGKTEFTFFVTNKTLKSIKIKEKASVEAGKKITLSVTKTPSDSLEGYTFSSTNTSVATVDPYTGVVTGVKEGTCDIVVVSDIKKVKATCTITVTKRTSPSVSDDGKIATDESGKKWEVADKVQPTQIKQNKQVTDKVGKYKVTKVINKSGKVTGGNVTYMGPYNKKATKATVPAKVKIGGVQFTVTAVANNAFKGCTKLKTVTIGTNVTTIGNMAFSGCTSLTSVTVNSKKLTKIGTKAFFGDKKLTKFVLKSTKLKTVGAGSFKNTSAKLKIKVPKAKVTKYTKMFKKAGMADTAKVTK